MKNLITLLVFSGFICLKTLANCPKNLIGIEEEEFFVLSDEEANAEIAQATCVSSGGNLIQEIQGPRKKRLIQFLSEKYTSDLQTVTVFQNPSAERPYYAKYRSSEGSNDPKDLSKWRKPDIGQIRSFKVPRSRSTPGFEHQVEFCYQRRSERDFFRFNGNCNGWISNFPVFISKSEVEGSRMLVRRPFDGESGWCARVFLSEDKIPQDWLSIAVSSNGKLYIPGTSVFVGIRSGVDQSKWFWNNGTSINDEEYYPATDKAVCQQITWPLTYNDGINVSPKECSKRAYFACQYQFVIKVEFMACNASQLQVSWRAFNFSRIVVNMTDLYVEVRDSSSSFMKITPYNASKMLIGGLESRSSYSLLCLLKAQNCGNSFTSSIVNVTTAYGLPDPVTTAYVFNSTPTNADCVIEWKYDSTDNNILSYEIRENRTDSSFLFIVETKNLQSTNNLTRSYIDLISFEGEASLKFMIQAVSCEGRSEAAEVQGSCYVPPRSSSLATGSLVGIVVGILIISTFVVGGAYFIKKNRNFQFNNKSNQFSDTTAVEPVDSLTTTLNLTSNMEANEQKQTEAPITANANQEVEESIYENCNQRHGEVSESTTITAERLVPAYLTNCANGFPSLRSQFKSILKFSNTYSKPHKIASAQENKKKNRYKNIYPYDHALVMLESGNYINASVIEGFGKNKNYIATQGPKPNTVNDFWELIWEQQTTIIVMLCNCVEKEKTKCENYWPEIGLKVSYGSFKIEALLEQNVGATAKRQLLLTKDDVQEKRTVFQFHFKAWPDHDIPMTTTGIYMLRKLVNKTAEEQATNSPIVVHCSAGAGRTGTYIAFDNCIKQLRKDDQVDFFNIVRDMRKNRRDMVQTVNQYIMVHKLVVESYLLPSTLSTIEEFVRFMDEGNWEKSIHEEFQYLNNMAVHSSVLEKNTWKGESTPYLNEESKIADINQLRYTSASAQIILDAHVIKSDHFPKTFIATLGPNDDKQDNFWNSIYMTNAKIVLALETSQYDKVQHMNEGALKIGEATIVVTQTKQNEHYLEQSVTLSFHNQKETKALPISYITLKSWKSIKPDVTHLMKILHKIMSLIETMDPGLKDSSILVYCKTGRRKTGIFLALAQLIQQCACGYIDVFRTVKDLRDLRRDAVSSLEICFLCEYQLDLHCALGILLYGRYYLLQYGSRVQEDYKLCYMLTREYFDKREAVYINNP